MLGAEDRSSENSALSLVVLVVRQGGPLQPRWRSRGRRYQARVLVPPVASLQ